MSAVLSRRPAVPAGLAGLAGLAGPTGPAEWTGPVGPGVPRVGFVNLMPHAEQFESMLMPQFAAAPPFQPVWIKVASRRYALDDRDSIHRRYQLLGAALQDAPLDAMVITGAAVEHLPFSEVRFLDEVARAVDYAARRDLPVLGLCWGALAVGHLVLGLAHQVFQTKVSGAFPTDLLVRDHPIGDGLDDRFWTAHSRFAGFDEATVAQAVRAGRMRVVARSAAAGTVIAESADHSILMHIGHPEYAGARLAEEYRRDLRLGLSNVHAPANIDLDHPVSQWRSHSLVFFANWIRLVHERASAPRQVRSS
jgi:homoserine O-succinyltransferase